MKYINIDNKKVKINNIFCIGLNYDNHVQEMGNKKNGVGKLNHLDKLMLNLDDLLYTNFNIVLK